MFVFGGYVNTSIQASARVDAFDPARNTWTRLRDMPEVVTHAGQAVDGNFIYIAGGFVGDHPGLGSTSAWRYDTRNDSWTRMPSLPAPRGGGAMAIVKRELHFFGGLTQAQFATVNQAEHWVLDLTAPSLGWKTSFGKVFAKCTTCSPVPLAISSTAPTAGRKRESTAAIGSRLRSVAGA